MSTISSSLKDFFNKTAAVASASTSAVVSSLQPSHKVVRNADGSIGVHIQVREGGRQDFFRMTPTPAVGRAYWFKNVYNGEYDEQCVMRYVENIPATHTGFRHSFYEMFRIAYANHGAVLLTADDVWTLISQQFSRYVDENAELLRDLFVDHEGKKEIIVDFPYIDLNRFMDEFMDKVVDEITLLTKGDITNALAYDFSTTTPFDHALGCLSTMSAMKHYFEYTMRCACGLTEVHFNGTLDDWQRLRAKTAFLTQTYARKGTNYFDLAKWGSDVDVILDQFIKTYQGKPSVEFWDKVFGLEEPVDSGGTKRIDGWIVRLLSNKDKLETDSIPLSHFKVPVKIDNNGNITHTTVVGGFSGIFVQSDGLIRAQRSYAVIDMTQSKNNKEQMQKLVAHLKKMQTAKAGYCEMEQIRSKLRNLRVNRDDVDIDTYRY